MTEPNEKLDEIERLVVQDEKEHKWVIWVLAICAIAVVVLFFLVVLLFV